MKPLVTLLILIFISTSLKAQKTEILGYQQCYNNTTLQQSITWYNHTIELYKNELKYFTTSNGNVLYDIEKQEIKLTTNKKTVVIKLQETGIELIAPQDSNSTFVPIIGSIKFNDIINNDSSNLEDFNAIKTTRVYNKRKETQGLIFSLDDNTSVNVFIFENINNGELFWNIGITDENNNETKLFFDIKKKQIWFINLCQKDTNAIRYKTLTAGVGLFFSRGKLTKTMALIGSRKDNKVIASRSLVEYNKKGRVKNTIIKIDNCSSSLK